MQVYRKVSVISNQEIINIINQSMTGLGVEKPYLSELIPDSYLPDSTGNFILKGSFFTPTMLVEITGVTINYSTFVSDNEFRVNVTIGSEEGYKNVTLNNGFEAVYNNALLVVLGDVYKPLTADWINTTPNVDISENGNLRITQIDASHQAEWNKEFDITKDHSIRFTPVVSQYGNPNGNSSYLAAYAFISDLSGTNIFSLASDADNSGYSRVYLNNTAIYAVNPRVNWYQNQPIIFELRYLVENGYYSIYIDNTLVKDITTFTPLENMKLYFNLDSNDIENIRYIEFA